MKNINAKVMYIFLSIVIPTVIMFLSGIVNLSIGVETAAFLLITIIMYIVGCALIYPILKEIGEALKEPYSRANTRWNNMDDKYKETYRRWNNSNYLYEFFNTLSGDRVRLEFWKRYINSIYRIL